MTTTTTALDTITSIIDRDDADFAARAVSLLRIDLAAVWSDLDDDGRDWLVESGIVAVVEADVECTDAEEWQSDWRAESNAAWPSYTLRITADGMEPMAVEGWHLVGPLGPDGNRQHEEWATEDSDGWQSGLPRVDGWEIKAGDNMSGGGLIPVWRDAAGQWTTPDRDALGGRRGGSLSDAAGTADHGSEPDWSDVERSDIEDVTDTVYVIRESAIVEVEMVSGGIAGHEVESYRRNGSYRTTIEYHAAAYSHSLTEDTYETADEARDALAEMSDDETVYATEAEAIAALAQRVQDETDAPAGLVMGTDDGGLYVASEDADEDDTDARYHLSASDMTAILRSGWMVVVDDVIDALGVRSTLDAAREWQSEMDRIVAAANPWVTLDDSVSAGNCRIGSQTFADVIRERTGARGEIGAARASLILALRNDSFTRRAVRIAAQRTLAR